MPIPLATLKAQQEILYPPSVGYGWVALLDTTTQSFSFTVDAGTDTLTATGHNFLTGTQVKVSSTTTLPAPLVAGTTYYAINVSGNTLKLSATSGGAAIDITSTGTGTHTIEDVQLGVGVSAVAQWIRKEVAYQGTMGRQQYTPLAAVEDLPNSRVFSPEVSLTFNNNGAASVVFDGAVLVKGGVVTAGNTTGTIDLFTLFDFPQTIAPGESRILKVPNIYANG